VAAGLQTRFSALGHHEGPAATRARRTGDHGDAQQSAGRGNRAVRTALKPRWSPMASRGLARRWPARLETCRGRTLVTAERAVGASTNRRPCERSALAFSRPPASNIVRSWPCFHNRSRFVNHAPPTPGAVQLGQHCATFEDSKHAGPRVPSPGDRSSRRLPARIAELKRSSDQGFEKWLFRPGVRFPAIGGVAHMQGGQPSFLDRVRIALSRVISQVIPQRKGGAPSAKRAGHVES